MAIKTYMAIESQTPFLRLRLSCKGHMDRSYHNGHVCGTLSMNLSLLNGFLQIINLIAVEEIESPVIDDADVAQVLFVNRFPILRRKLRG